jgi:hypothetical protein
MSETKHLPTRFRFTQNKRYRDDVGSFGSDLPIGWLPAVLKERALGAYADVALVRHITGDNILRERRRRAAAANAAAPLSDAANGRRYARANPSTYEPGRWLR